MSIAQYNPSTLKAMYNATTKKQLALRCPWCEGVMPGSVTLEFSDVADCICSDWGAAGGRRVVPDIEALINDQHTLPYAGYVSDWTYCKWYKKVNTDDYTLQMWTTNECIGDPPITYPSKYYEIIIRRFQNYIEVSFSMRFSYWDVWFFTGKADPCTGSPDCLCSDDFPLSNLTGCFFSGFGVCESGEVAIV